jgi:hypothetical protein
MFVIEGSSASEFYEQVVPEDASRRNIFLFRERVTPIPKSACDAKGLTRECGDAAESMPVLARFEGVKLCLTNSSLVDEPFETIVFA